jgi:hypothetical protein
VSSHAQVLAARVANLEATRFAALVIAWLVERGTIQPMPTDCGMTHLAHPPGPRFLEAVVPQKPGVTDVRTLRTNGMEVEHSLRAMLITAGDDMPGFACPSCKQAVEADDVFPLLDQISNPFHLPPETRCPGCGTMTRVNDLDVTGGAFANLTFRFWNWWPLKEAFVAELAERIGTKVTVLYDRS